VHQFKNKLHIIRDCNFEIQTLDDAEYLTTFLSNFFPDPGRVTLGISELLINAVEHGNLGITYAEKTELNKQSKWQEEVQRRLSLPEYKDKKVFVNLVKENREIVITITDEGTGFDWSDYMEMSAERATDNHGRGIAMSKMASFDELEYRGKGNEVVCRVFLPT
ncbi:MAG: ATP-binding protein, partial [Nitrospirota bacterium]|nr:ATP-binding protein [Nitrospirota bacterium]